MPRPKLIRGNTKDHKVTVRLDDATYQSLKEAMERGTITNLSEALRNMIRQKLWQEMVSEEIGRDVRINEISEKDLRKSIDLLLGDLDIAKRKDLFKSDGFFEGLFAAIGGLAKELILEFERRDAQKKTDKS